jgi:hypothetical protein
MSRVIRRPRTALAVLAIAVLILAGPTAASAAKVAAGPFEALFGLTTAPGGSLLVADAAQGIVAIDTKGNRTLFAGLPGATDVSTVGAADVYAITGGCDDDPEAIWDDASCARLYRISKGHATVVADLGEFEKTVNPDGPEINPNPFDVEVLNGGGVLVADAGGNDVLYVDNKGRIEWVATLPEALVSTANAKSLFGCPAGAPGICGLPERIPGQAVATSIAIGPDGALYVGELKGFPAPTGESKIWRIEPGTLHARCGTAGETRCTVVGGGFTSIIDLQFGPDGTLYVTEFDEASWAAVEIFGNPTGGTINACEWGTFPFSCDAVETDEALMMPTATTIGADGQLYATVWSLVPGLADVVAVP